MSISYQILGKPSNDNALLVRIDSGQQIEHLLFDCGEGCLEKVPVGIVQKIDHLFFSHLHMDHIAGFDSFFRSNYNRNTRPNHIWGPPQTARIIQHRFQGFMWNLHGSMSCPWIVSDIYPQEYTTYRYELQEAFSVNHPMQTCQYQKTLFETKNYEVGVFTLNHRTPSLAYLIREKPSLNIDVQKMNALGLSSGPWLKLFKELKEGCVVSQSSGTSYTFKELRKSLLLEKPGDSIAYLTDFLPDKQTIKDVAAFLDGCQTIVCEAHYRNSDIELARQNYHSTTGLTASIALKANADKLVLIHISDRYDLRQYGEILNEAREIFPSSYFSAEWKL
jgi:ribonuclease Z